MKKRITVAVLAVMFVVNGSGYAFEAWNNPRDLGSSAAAAGNALAKKLEQRILKKQQEAAKLDLGDLAGFSRQIIREIKKEHPNFSKVINLGKTSDSYLVDRRDDSVRVSTYLVEVQDGDEVSYYNLKHLMHTMLVEHKFVVISNFMAQYMPQSQAQVAKKTLGI